MLGQIQLVGIPDPNGARITILSHRDEILSIANEKDPMLVKVGGGARDIEVRVLESSRGPMVITHLIVDCRDAMGANLVNTLCEALAARPDAAFAFGLGLAAERYQGNWIPHQLRSAVEDGVFFAGDSAGHCLPLTAEGIRTALYFGLACGRELRRVPVKPDDLVGL